MPLEDSDLSSKQSGPRENKATQAQGQSVRKMKLKHEVEVRKVATADQDAAFTDLKGAKASMHSFYTTDGKANAQQKATAYTMRVS